MDKADSSEISDLYEDSNECVGIQLSSYANKRQKVKTNSDIPSTSNAITEANTSQPTTTVIIENTDLSYLNLSSEDTQNTETIKNQRKEKLEQEKNDLRKKRGCGVIQVDLHAIAHC